MEMLEALIKRYQAQIAEAEATIEIYLNNSVGIGEHPQHIEELDKLFGKIAEAEDKLKVIEGWEDQ
jgi:ABC-type enterochelin transport system substrate-binding protein